MRGLPSLPRRLNRMEQQQAGRALEAEIAWLATEYGLHPNEVRHELEAHIQLRELYGPEPVDVTISRLADQYKLDAADLRAEYERVLAKRRGCTSWSV